MSILIKEYQIPFLGKVELLEATGYFVSLNGKYFANNKELGNFCKNCETAEELIERTGIEIKRYFEAKKNSCKSEIREKIKEKGTLEVLLSGLTFTSKEKGFGAWLRIYQTENPSQQEYQKSQ